MKAKNQTYQNVMETLVNQEIQYQLNHGKVPEQLEVYLNLLEVATYALNRLPALYASSTEGIEKQRKKAQQLYLKKIKQAVSLGFAAVERDPLRRSHPIEPENHNVIEQAKETLPELGDIVSQQELSWIVAFMENFLERIKNKRITDEEVAKLYYLLYYYLQENS